MRKAAPKASKTSSTTRAQKASKAASAPKAPKSYEAFVARYPKLRQAWDAIHEAGSEGPLDERTVRLVKLGIAIGAMREGAIHSSLRKAVAIGVDAAELEQVIALAASTLGLPSTVAVYTWVQGHGARTSARKR